MDDEDLEESLFDDEFGESERPSYLPPPTPKLTSGTAQTDGGGSEVRSKSLVFPEAPERTPQLSATTDYPPTPLPHLPIHQELGIPLSALRDWHVATETLETKALDSRLAQSLAQVDSEKVASSTTDSARRRALRSSLQLDCLRRKDEVGGFHRRQRERERLAAASVVPLVEAMRGWSGSVEDQGKLLSRRQQPPQSLPMRLGANLSRKSSQASATSAHDNDPFASPLRQLLGGLQQCEPAKCFALDAAMQEAFVSLRGNNTSSFSSSSEASFSSSSSEASSSAASTPTASGGASGGGGGGASMSGVSAAGDDERRAANLRSQRLDYLSAYLQVVFRVPPSRLTRPRALNLWRSPSGTRLASTHSLGVVSSAFVQVWSGLYSAPLLRAEQRGSSARPAVDHALRDLLVWRGFMHSVVLWKWEATFISSAVRLSVEEASQLVWEALDEALPCLVPEAYRLFCCATRGADEWLHAQVQLTSTFLRGRSASAVCDLLGVSKHLRLDLDLVLDLDLAHCGLSGTAYEPALLVLRQGLEGSLSTTKKVAAVAATLRELCACVARWHQQQQQRKHQCSNRNVNSSSNSNSSSGGGGGEKGSDGGTGGGSGGSNSSSPSPSSSSAVKQGQLAADDLLPLLQLLLAVGCATEAQPSPPCAAGEVDEKRGGGALRCLEAQGAYIDALLPLHLTASEPGYCLALFQTAVAALHAAVASDVRERQQQQHGPKNAASLANPMLAIWGLDGATTARTAADLEKQLSSRGDKVSQDSHVGAPTATELLKDAPDLGLHGE